MTGLSQCRFSGVHDNLIAGDETGPPSGRRVILLHGGGQTRHAWRKVSERLAGLGFRAVCIDQRGHGDSSWDQQGRYRCTDFSGDLLEVVRQIDDRQGGDGQGGDGPDLRPVVVGASLGGLAAMLAVGEDHKARIAGLILVDVTPHVNPAGVTRITGFMRAHGRDGFASVEDAADAVAGYLPHRRRPVSADGLRKNLKQRADGRYIWHWDPCFLDGDHAIDNQQREVRARLVGAVRQIRVPLMLVRGSRSELIDDDHVAEFLDLAPHAEVADVRGAGHMVAGDDNDAFGDAVAGFLLRHFNASPDV